LSVNPETAEAAAYWPILVYLVCVIATIIGMLGMSFFLGQRHHDRQMGEVYESGVPPTGPARVRFSVKFYMIAVLFVIFDLEVAFLIAWAVALREVGWSGYIGAMVFIGILTVALIYEWRQGALEWGSPWQETRRR